MIGSFEGVIGALWSSLGLPRPELRADGTATLVVDGTTLVLKPSPDERHVVISATVGRLSTDSLRQSDQLRQLLREEAALTLSRRAALRFEPGDSGPAEILGQAMAPCRADALPALRRAVEDVLFLIDVHRPTLRPVARTGGSAPTLAPTELEGSLIFRL